MTRSFSLRPDVHVVDVWDDLVVLDIRADAYFCLPGAGEAWRDLQRPDVGVADEALAQALIDGGLATAEAGEPSRRSQALPSATLLGGPAEPARRRDLWNLLGACGDLLARYRGRRFSDILAYVRRSGAVMAADPDDAELQRLCRVFHRWVIWLPVSGKCLIRSFLLLRFLQRSGRDAAWVFGVAVWPFEAHCWLQAGALALDEFPERVAGFTPIWTA